MIIEETITVFVVRCDGCGESIGSAEDAYFFAMKEEAEDKMYDFGWMRDENGNTYCEDCAAKKVES